VDLYNLKVKEAAEAIPFKAFNLERAEKEKSMFIYSSITAQK